MAIVFVSPKEKQKIFFGGVVIVLILALVIGALILFLPDFLSKNPNILIETSPKTSGVVIVKPDIAVNLDVINSSAVKDLHLFGALETEFSYTVKDKTGKTVTGNISADTKGNAQKLLEEAGFTVVTLQEVSVGRSEPFIAY